MSEHNDLIDRLLAELRRETEEIAYVLGDDKFSHGALHRSLLRAGLRLREKGSPGE